MLKPSLDPKSDRDLEKLARAIGQMPEVIRKVAVGTVSDTIKDVHTREIVEMHRTFDRPTPYVIRGLKMLRPGARKGPFRATNSRALIGDAAVYFETFRGTGGNSPNEVVRPHVYGGPRRMKRSEARLNANRGTGFMVPTQAMPRDSHGNPSGNRIAQMLQELGTIETARPSRKNQRKNRKTARYFLMGKKGNPVGIGERRGKTSVKMMMKFRSRAPQYSKTFNFYEVGRAQALVSAPRHFNRIFNSYRRKVGL